MTISIMARQEIRIRTIKKAEEILLSLCLLYIFARFFIIQEDPPRKQSFRRSFSEHLVFQHLQYLDSDHCQKDDKSKDRRCCEKF
jgi:hypothetical protein